MLIIPLSESLILLEVFIIIITTHALFAPIFIFYDKNNFYVKYDEKFIKIT